MDWQVFILIIRRNAESIQDSIAIAVATKKGLKNGIHERNRSLNDIDISTKVDLIFCRLVMTKWPVVSF